MNAARRLTLATLVTLCALAGSLLFSSAPALALLTRPYLSQLTGFGNPTGLTVDSSSHLYVADSGRKIVDRFDSSGAALAFSASESYVEGAKLTGTPSGPFNEPQGVAVDNSTGHIYVSDGRGRVVDVFSSAGEYLSQLIGTPPAAPVSGAFGNPHGLAVDQTTHDLYVADSGSYSGSSVVDVFNAMGAYVSQFGSGVLSGNGNYAESVSVNDLTENAYVGDSGPAVVYVFGSLGTSLPLEWRGAGTPNGSFGGSFVYVGLDRSSGHVYVADTGHAVVNEFNSSSSEEYVSQVKGTPSGPFGRPQAVAIDPNSHDLYVADGGGVVDVFGPDAVLPDVSTEPASEVTVSKAVLHGSVNPDGIPIVSCQFEYGTNETYGHNVPCTPANPGSGTSGVPVSANIAGLQPDTIYYFRVLAGNANGVNRSESKDRSESKVFETLGALTIDEESTSGVTQTSATLQARVNPHGFDTTYHFEYGTSTGYGTSVPLPDSDLGSGTSDAIASNGIGGLNLDTTYHFRIVATSSQGTLDGPDQTFTTEPAVRIDNESFSAGSTNATLSAKVNRFGTSTTVYFEFGTSASYGSSTPEVNIGAGETDAAATALLTGLRPDTVYHFRAVAANALGTTRGADVSITTYPPNAAVVPDGRVYEMVTPVGNQDANVYVPSSRSGIDRIITDYPFQASLDGNAVAYVGDPSSGGNGDSGNGGGNQYLAKRAPAGGWTQVDIAPPPPINSSTVSSTAWPTYEAFSSDLSVAILNSSYTLSASVSVGYQNLYSRTASDGNYHPFFTGTPPHRNRTYPGPFTTAHNYSVSISGESLLFAGASSDFSHLLFEANDTLTPNAIDGGAEQNNLYDSVNGQLQLINVLPSGTPDPNATFGAPALTEYSNPPDFSHVISNDGSRIFWTDLNTGDLYVRENSGTPQARTVQLDASQGPGGGGGGRFWTASSDGSKAFFTDGAPAGLTNSTISGSGANLYEYDVPSGHLTDLTASSKAEVEGVLGASEDGSYVYFVAKGALGAAATAGQPNLYLHHGGVTTFIATLSPIDNELPQLSGGENSGVAGDWQPGLGHRTAEVTPDGRHLVFSAVESLTGYPNAGLQEVYAYEAASGRLVCASCDPSGAPPPTSAGQGVGVAALLPIGWSATRQPHWISNDGSRVFFDSIEPLVPQDINGRQDVYEWEQDGAGSCRHNGGCVYLLSGGTSSDAYLIDASASGNDVFFATRAQLVSHDQNGNFDLYDARVDGAVPLTPPQCSGTGCQGVPPAPPIFATPSSVTYNGVGDFASPAAKSVKTARKKGRATKCRKGTVKKHGKCVKKKAKKSAKGRK